MINYKMTGRVLTIQRVALPAVRIWPAELRNCGASLKSFSSFEKWKARGMLITGWLQRTHSVKIERAWIFPILLGSATYGFVDCVKCFNNDQKYLMRVLFCQLCQQAAWSSTMREVWHIAGWQAAQTAATPSLWLRRQKRAEKSRTVGVLGGPFAPQ